MVLVKLNLLSSTFTATFLYQGSLCQIDVFEHDFGQQLYEVAV